jgi:hypothetical protein
VLLRREGVYDAEAELAMTSSNLLGDLPGSFPFLSVRRDRSLDIITDPDAQIMMQISVVRIADVELGKKGLAVGSGCRAEITRHDGFEV